MDLDKAVASQIQNIQAKTGKTLEELATLIAATNLAKHGEKLAWAKANLGLGHGDANALVLTLSKLASESAPAADPLDDIYTGPKATLRPIHEAIMAEVSTWGDFEVHPKKGYVALRRKKQFAMIGPATNSRVELGLNAKELSGPERLEPQAPGGMCQYKVKLTDVSQVDDELFRWLRTCFDFSGA
jgi:hypothetical protein